MQTVVQKDVLLENNLKINCCFTRSHQISVTLTQKLIHLVRQDDSVIKLVRGRIIVKRCVVGGAITQCAYAERNDVTASFIGAVT